MQLRTVGRISGWGLIVGAALYYVLVFAVEYFTLHAAIYGRHWAHAGWLRQHMAGGVIAHLVRPFQL